MANVRAFRSGNWSDTNPATSPWGTGGVLYAPAANDDVYSNNFTIHVDTNVTVNSVTNGTATSRLWKDGATTTATAGGTFNLLNDTFFTVLSVIAGGSTIGTLSLSGTNGSQIIGSVVPSVGGTANHAAILNNSIGTLRITGNVEGGFDSRGVINNSNGTIIVTGNVTGKVQFADAIKNNAGGTIIVTGNITGGSGNLSYGVYNVSTGIGSTNIIVGNVRGGSHSGAQGIISLGSGTVNIIGNVVATSATNAFVSSNASAINKISGNIINHPNGTAAIYATRYVVDPIPQNSFIQYSNVNQFSTDSLSAFSMPPVSSVRFGTSYANGTLTGTCKVPSQNSVNVGVPVDNTVGTAFLTPASLFDTSVASLTSSNTLGARLKNSATVQSVGNIIASFSN